MCGDSHTATHGAFGALAFGIGTSEVEHVLATQTPETGAREDHEKSKSVAKRHRALPRKTLCWQSLVKPVAPAVPVMSSNSAAKPFAIWSMEGRMTLCNMAIEMGAKAGLVAPDETTFNYVQGRPARAEGP